MKKVTLILSLFLASFVAFSQTKVATDSKGNFIAQKDSKMQSKNKPTGKTFTTAKGEQFPVYITDKGKYYVLRTSKETGNEYKQYLKTE